MESFSHYQPLTKSGKGANISDRKLTDLSIEETNFLMSKYNWLAFTNNPHTENEIINYLNQFGKLNQNNRRYGTTLKLDGSKNKEGEVLLGNGYMPLHRDGSLMNADIRMVGIFCNEYKNVTKGGRTFITDSATALDEIPKEYIEIIRKRGFEGKPVDSYYLKSSDMWHPIPGFTDDEGQSYLNAGFPSPEGEKPSWLIRIPGISDEKFKEIFSTLTNVFMSDKYCYFHEWNEGDLLLFDNRKTMHGREAFIGQRALANIQVLAE